MTAGLQTRSGSPAAAERSNSRPPASAERILGLDGLRFLAAAAVLIYHFTARWSTVWGRPPEEVFPRLGGVVVYGAIGPELFFVISGFVILMTAWGRDARGVFASRMARLFPAYWSAVVLTSLLLMVLWRDGKKISIGEALVNLTMLQSLFGVRHVDGVYWTLWTELRFYALVVLLLLVGLTRRRILAACALWPPAAILAEALDAEPFATILLGNYAPLFAGGMVLYVIFRDGHTAGRWALCALDAALAARFVTPGVVASVARNTAFDAAPEVVAGLLLASFAAVGALTLTRLRFVRAAWLPALGALTYPLYLLHEHWGWWVIALSRDSIGVLGALVAAIVVSLGLSTAVHYGVERKIGPRLRASLAGVPRAELPGRSGTAGKSPVPATAGGE